MNSAQVLDTSALGAGCGSSIMSCSPSIEAVDDVNVNDQEQIKRRREELEKLEKEKQKREWLEYQRKLHRKQLLTE